MNKIHVVEFTSGTTAKTITGLFQWNHGQILQIKGLNLPTAVEVHFALRRSGEAIPRIGVTKDGVTEVEIPDVLFRTMMTSDYDIYAYVYVSDEEYGSTTHEIIMKVKSRPMPEDIQNDFDEIMKAVKTLADGKVDKNQGTENNGKFLGVVDGYLVLVDAPSGTTDAVRYVEQELTEEQQEQARANIGAANVTYDTETKTLNICLGGGTTNGLIEQIEDYVIENEIEKIVIDGVEVNLSRYAKKEETDRLSKEIENQQKEIDELKESGTGGTVIVEPMEDDIPKVYFTGTLPTSKGEGDLPVTIHYISKTENFKYYATLKVQGDSSTSYPKKNFTLKMYEDKALENKAKYAFRNWGNLNKFVLKAHWIDHSHVRNVGTSKMWGKIVKSRSDYESLPEELRNAPNNGATDGFTCKVFANGIYQGLYEWIVPKDKIFGQDRDNPNHSIMNSEKNNQDTCAFATTSPVMSYWSEELQDSMSSAISTSFSNFIKFVAGSTDEEFVANAENYFDVQSVIDFDIFARVFCIADNLCKNQIFFTYDGVKWYEGAWDMDGVLGLPPTGRAWFTYDTAFQTGYVAYLDYGITNMLYERVEKLFLDRFVTRYNQLRESVLSVANIIDVYDRLTDVIKTYDGLLEEDFAETTGNGAFTGIPNTSQNNIQQIRNFIAQRVLYMDEVITNMGSNEEPDTPIEPEEPEVTLSSISTTYTGGDVAVGTALNSLTGITVTGTYSDGTTTTVTGYTLSGTIAEGENTITVSYSGLTTTFTIVGIVEEDEESNAGILDGVSFYKGYINGTPTNANYGKISDSDVDIVSDAFNVSEYSHLFIQANFSKDVYVPSCRIVFYVAEEANKGNIVSAINGNTEDGGKSINWDIDVPNGAIYARLSFNIGVNNGNGFTDVTIKETSDGNVIGELLYP